MFAYSQPAAFSLLSILLLVIPVSRGRHFEELRPSEADVDEIAVKDYSLPSFSEPKRQKSAEMEAFLTSTELNKRTGRCVRYSIALERVCKALHREFETLCTVEQREKACESIKRCRCNPGGECRSCTYAS